MASGDINSIVMDLLAIIADLKSTDPKVAQIKDLLAQLPRAAKCEREAATAALEESKDEVRHLRRKLDRARRHDSDGNRGRGGSVKAEKNGQKLDDEDGVSIVIITSWTR